MRAQDVIDSLRAEHSALHDLRAALDGQRRAVSGGDVDEIIESTERVSSLSERLAVAQAWRESALAEMTGDEPKTLARLLEEMKVPMSDEILALAQEVQGEQNVVVRNLAINCTAIGQALEMTSLTLQQFGGEPERKAFYSSRSRGDEEGGIMFDEMA